MRKSVQRLLILMVVTILFIGMSYAHPINPQGGKGKSLTNDDFPDANPSRESNDKSEEETSKSSKSSSKSKSSRKSKEESGGHQLALPKLHFRVLDLQLQAAGEADNRNTRDEIIRLKSQIAQAKPEQVDDIEWRDLEFRKRYVALKIKLIEAEKEADFAGSNIQSERRKVKKGSRSNNRMQGVRKAQGEATEANDKVEEIKAEIEALIEEGKLAGAGDRAFR